MLAGGERMVIGCTDEQRADLERAVSSERRVRAWRRYQALLRLAAGEAPETVAKTLGCARSSVFAWAAAWRDHGLAGLTPRPHGGGRPLRLEGDGQARLHQVLMEDPQQHGQHTTGWTVPLLRAELAAAGYAVSGRTIRRALHRQGWRWKRPKYVLGRPDPEYAQKKARSRSG